jgi:hypothetical protein
MASTDVAYLSNISCHTAFWITHGAVFELLSYQRYAWLSKAESLKYLGPARRHQNFIHKEV